MAYVQSAEFFFILACCGASLAMAAISFLRDAGSITTKLFLSLTVTACIVLISTALAFHAQDAQHAILWLRVTAGSLALFVPLLSAFLSTFPSRTLLVPWTFIVVLATAGLLGIALSFTPAIIFTADQEGRHIIPVFGPIFPLYAAGILVGVVAGIVGLFRHLHLTNGATHIQRRYLLTGSIVALLFLCGSTLLNYISQERTRIDFFTAVVYLTFASFSAYALTKQRLFSISAILTRALTNGIVLLLSTLAYGVLFSSMLIIFDLPLNSTTLLYVTLAVLLAVIITFVLPLISHALENLVNRFVFRHHTDPQQIYNRLSETITSTLDLISLATQSVNILREELHVSFLIAALKTQNEYTFVRSSQSPSEDPPMHDITTQLAQTSGIILLDTLENEQLKSWMERYHISVIVPLEVKAEVIGYLLFGPKASGEVFYESDLQVLPNVADQLAIAFQNSLAVLKISKFNDTLKDEVKRATHDLSKANEELKALDKLKDEFLSMASHELKSPMNAIKNYLWMAMNIGKNEPEKMPQFLSTAYQATQRLIALVSDLLDVSRIESGRVTLSIKVVDIQLIVKEICDMFYQEAQQKNITLESTITTRIVVKADDQKLRQILSNFVSNAIKYTPKGSITIAAQEIGGMVRLSVKDTGMGIPKEHQHKLFAKFSRVPGATKEQALIEGTGLGLYISKQLSELMGGNVGFESTEGAGSTFWVELPKG